jgi:hypothetical protein
VPHTAASIQPFCSVNGAPETPQWARSPTTPPPSAIPSSMPFSVRLHLRFLPWWARHVPHSIPVLSVRWIVLGIEFLCSPAMAPPWNVAGFLFWPEHRRRLFLD